MSKMSKAHAEDTIREGVPEDDAPVGRTEYSVTRNGHTYRVVKDNFGYIIEVDGEQRGWQITRQFAYRVVDEMSGLRPYKPDC